MRTTPFVDNDLADSNRVTAAWFNAVDLRAFPLDTLALLRAMTVPIGLALVDVRGALAANDGGAGTFWWDAASTEADNGGTVIAPTGAAAGRWIRIYEELSVKYFGATGDGLTDDTVALQLALAAAAGKKLVFPAGAYVLTASLVVPVDTDLEFEAGAVIDASGATIISPALISCIGSIGGALGGGLSVAVAAGVRSITFVSAPALVAGDLVALRSTALWNPGNAAWTKGEYLIVKSISGAVVTFTASIIDSYATAGASVSKITPTRTRIYGAGKILGNSADTANMPMVQIKYGMHNEVSGLTIENPTSHGVEVVSCFAPTIHDVKIGKYVADAGAIQGVGILVSGCQYGHVYDCTSQAHRHGASTGGGGLVVDRFNLFEHNSLGSAAGPAAADFHGNAEFCTYRGNQIDGHINLSGVSNSLIDNIINPSVSVTNLIALEFAIGLDFTIEGNTFNLRGSGYVLDASSADDINADTTRNGVFKFRRNKVVDSYAGSNSYLFFTNQGSTAECRIEVNDNEFRKTNNSYFGSILAVSKTTGDFFSSVVFQDNTCIGTHLGTVEADEIVKRNNTIIRFTGEVEDTTLRTSAGHIFVEDNYIKGGGRLTLAIPAGGATALLISFKQNTIIETTRDYPVLFSSATEVISEGNWVGSAADATQLAPVYFSTITSLTIAGDQYQGEGAPVFDTVASVRPSNFSFQRTVALTTPAASFPVWTIPTNMSFLPTAVQGRADTNITATTGNFWGVGVVGANRLRDYGACGTAAAASLHSKNAKLRYLAAPADATQIADSAEVIALTSLATNADGAVAGSNIGGASQTITLRLAGNLVGDLPNLP